MTELFATSAGKDCKISLATLPRTVLLVPLAPLCVLMEPTRSFPFSGPPRAISGPSSLCKHSEPKSSSLCLAFSLGLEILSVILLLCASSRGRCGPS
uniref:Uncharacterized protein n=1 Tax=Rhizophora mucronata TaxID=61149 RepID=A0A2P2JZ34_RHIMU